jgi:uncharacterized membrane protein YciS (DUF1049 family)
MIRAPIKTYILLAIFVALAAPITYYSINYNIGFLIPWSLAGLFFILWRIKNFKLSRVSKKSKTKVKRLL